MACRHFIVPPHLLRGIAESKVNPDHIRKAAMESLGAREKLTKVRCDRFAALATPRGYQRSGEGPSGVQRQQIVPPDMLRNISESEQVDEAARVRAKRDLEHLEGLMGQKQGKSTLYRFSPRLTGHSQSSPIVHPANPKCEQGLEERITSSGHLRRQEHIG